MKLLMIASLMLTSSLCLAAGESTEQKLIQCLEEKNELLKSSIEQKKYTSTTLVAQDWSGDETGYTPDPALRSKDGANAVLGERCTTLGGQYVSSSLTCVRLRASNSMTAGVCSGVCNVLEK